MLLRLTVLLSVGGDLPILSVDTPGDNQAFKFRRRGVSDPAHLLTVEVSCRLSHTVTRDKRRRSREGRIRPHPLHFRPSCQERGGKDLIAAPSDDLFLEHRTV